MNYEKDIDLSRLIEAKGIKVTDHRGRCPFGDHEADTLVIDPTANTWSCEAGCGEGGVVNWVSRVEGVSLTHAEALLKADFDPTDDAVVKTSTVPKLPVLIEPGATDDAVLDKVIDYYHRVLLGSPDVLSWLRNNGIRDPEVITHFRLGLCDRTLGYRIPKANRAAGKAVREQLKRIGVFRDSGHEHFRGSLVVPLFNEAGKVTNIYGRKLRDDLRAGTPMDTWLTDICAGVFNVNGIVDGQKLVLTGSILDALAWWSAGMRNVTSTMSKKDVSTDIKSIISNRNIPSTIVAVPRNENIDGILDDLRELGVEVHRVIFPSKMDAVDVVKQATDPKEALYALLRAAEWISGSSSKVKSPTPPEPVQEQQEPIANDTGEVVVVRGDRRWRVRGLDGITSHNSMNVNLHVAIGDNSAYHVDVVELYSARQRTTFLSAAATELNVDQRILKKDLGQVLLHLEGLVDGRIRDTHANGKNHAIPVTDADREKALQLLRDPKVLDRVVTDIDALGVVGEHKNKKVAYLAAISRKLPNPLAVVIQSSPSSGKSALLDAVLRLVPDEDVLAFSAITGRSLYYLPKDGLANKVLAVAEEEGAGRASYALKLLQSEGSLSIASTAKDSKSGRLSTQTYSVAGPIALLMTTTSMNVDEELMSRCIVICADEGRDQTRAIHAEQRRRLSLDGLLGRRDVAGIRKLHHDAQRLLRPLHVVVPDGLDIKSGDHRVRHRRDHQKLLGLVQAVALLRQHQRVNKETPTGIKYIEATKDDVDVAVELLGKDDIGELPPGTRDFLAAVRGHVRTRAVADGIDISDVRFTRRELRENLHWGDTQVKVHLGRLVDLELVLRHRGQPPVYELVYTGDVGVPDPLEGNDTTMEGDPDRSGLGRPLVGGWSGGTPTDA